MPSTIEFLMTLADTDVNIEEIQINITYIEI